MPIPIGDYNPKIQVDPSIQPGLYATAQNLTLYSGPPKLELIGDRPLWPLALVQGVNINANQSVMQLFEVGSHRSVMLGGPALYTASLSQVYYYGPNLLRQLYAAYDASADGGNDGILSSPLLPDYAEGFVEGALGEMGSTWYQHTFRDTAGSGAVYQALHADLFKQPIGLGYILRDNDSNILAHYFLQQCMVPNYGFALDANGIIFQESIGLRFERLVPVDVTIENQDLLKLLQKTGDYDPSATF